MDNSMQAALTAVRAVHFAAAIVLFGQFAYACAVAPGRALPARFRATAGWSLGIAVASALAWLAIEASDMSGLPMRQALREGTVEIVLTRTLFGNAWLARGALALAIAVALAAMGTDDAAPRPAARVGGAIAALLFLAALAGAGHAAGDAGADRLFHGTADALHLAAAGGWLGALVPLVALLRESAARPTAEALAKAAQAVARFSLLGLACVGTLALTGIVNACYAIHRFPELVTSRYGQELLVKLGLVALIVILAAVNRERLSPRIAPGEAARAGPALRALLRNSVAEVVLGFAIVAIVANLGITMPPMHGR